MVFLVYLITLFVFVNSFKVKLHWFFSFIINFCYGKKLLLN